MFTSLLALGLGGESEMNQIVKSPHSPVCVAVAQLEFTASHIMQNLILFGIFLGRHAVSQVA